MVGRFYGTTFANPRSSRNIYFLMTGFSGRQLAFSKTFKIKK